MKAIAEHTGQPAHDAGATNLRSFPQPVSGPGFAPGTIRLIESAGSDGAAALAVQFHCAVDHDRTRPDFWRQVQAILKAAGFSPDDPLADEDGELFCPTSFYSAKAVLAATKVYTQANWPELFPDMARLSECIGGGRAVEESPSGSAPWGMSSAVCVEEGVPG